MTGERAKILLDRTAPGLFVVIWATGWIVAHFGGDQPLVFLSWRYGLAGLVLLALSLATRASWPHGAAAIGHALVSGILLHALYLGGVWWAIAHGMEASVSALLAAIQPLATALLAPALAGERVGAPQWAGLGLGLVGLVLVLGPKLAGVDPVHLGTILVPLLVNVGAMLAVTAGTFYQRRFLRAGDLRTITVVQYAGALLVTLPVALATEAPVLDWTAPRVAAMAWAVFGLSIGAIGLMLFLIRRGTVSRTAQLIFLIPPTASLQAWLLLGERLSGPQLAGMAVTVAGVALAARPAPVARRA